MRPPELLSWTESHTGMQVTTQFVALGPDRTEVRIHQKYVPEAFLLPEVEAGFLSSLDRFDAYLAGVTGSESSTGGITMTLDTALHVDVDVVAAIADEYRAWPTTSKRRIRSCGTRRHCARAGAPARSWPT